MVRNVSVAVCCLAINAGQAFAQNRHGLIKQPSSAGVPNAPVSLTPSMVDVHKLFRILSSSGQLNVLFNHMSDKTEYAHFPDDVASYTGTDCRSLFTTVSGTTVSVDWTETAEVSESDLGISTIGVDIQGPVTVEVGAAASDFIVGGRERSLELALSNNTVRERVVKAIKFAISHCNTPSPF